MDLPALTATVWAAIAFILAIVALYRLHQLRYDMGYERAAIYTHVDKRTEVEWKQTETNLVCMFDRLEKRLMREMHERLAREIGDLRNGLKRSQQEE